MKIETPKIAAACWMVRWLLCRHALTRSQTRCEMGPMERVEAKGDGEALIDHIPHTGEGWR